MTSTPGSWSGRAAKCSTRGPGASTAPSSACTTPKVTSWDDLNGDERYIIGGSESGVDAAVALAAAGRRAVVFDREEPWERRGSDPSELLSPFTKERLNSAMDSGRVKLRGGCAVIGVRREDNGYRLALEDGEVVHCAEKPILASGFVGSASLVRSLFEWRDDDFPLLTENDESTVAKGLFLVGPQVRQGDVIFCFIYKFRQRFAVVANQIARPAADQHGTARGVPELRNVPRRSILLRR